MKIAFPTNEKKGLESKVAFHFGRAKFFLIFDTKKREFQILKNPEVFGGEKLPPDFLKDHKVEVVVVFGLGPKAIEKFKNYKIEMFKAEEGTIKENLEKFENKELKKLLKK